MTQLLTAAQAASATGAKFGPHGVSLDVRGFLSSSGGQQLLKQIREARALLQAPEGRDHIRQLSRG